MITKKVNRYYCDFCKKSGGAAGHMKKHESRCTMNPNRECGMCKMMGYNQPDLAEIIALLPEMVTVEREDFNGCAIGTEIEELSAKEIKQSLDMVREKTNNCPACILAVYRQAGIYLSLLEDFDFKEECKDSWAEFNDRNY